MKDHRLLKVIRRDRMSQRGISHWNKKIRKGVYKYVFRSLGDKYLSLRMAENRMEFAKWLFQSYGYGYFYVCTWRMRKTGGSNKAKPTPYRIAIIEIEKTEGGFRPRFIDMTRISKERWFESGKKELRKIERASIPI